MSARTHTDLIARLRGGPYVYDGPTTHETMIEAADEIKRLRAMTAGIEEIASALRLAIADKRAFAVCVEGRNGSTFTLHNCDDSITSARMLERFARQQRGSEK